MNPTDAKAQLPPDIIRKITARVYALWLRDRQLARERTGKRGTARRR